MDEEVVFLGAIALISFAYCIVNIVSYLLYKDSSGKTQGVIISFKTISLPTEKMRNSKWATITYTVDGKRYTSKKRIQVPMTEDVGSKVLVRYDTKQPERLYCFSVKRIAVSALVMIGSLIIIGLIFLS